MSLHTLCWFGLLTKETTLFFQTLADPPNFNEIEIKIFEAGFSSSKSHTKRLISEIRRRFFIVADYIPNTNDLRDLAHSKLSSMIKGQIYFVYLAKFDEIY